MKILTCNIRFSSMGFDFNERSWDQRKNVCCPMLKESNADVICLQECHSRQFQDISETLGDTYRPFWHLTSTEEGVFPENAIFYKWRDIQVVDHGAYALSETPHIQGSTSWNAECKRFVNYIILKFPDLGCVRVVNTHFDHASQLAREKEAEMVCQDADAYTPEMPQILTGDLNCDVTNPAIQYLLKSWRDSYFEATGVREPGFTFHEFIGEAWHGDLGICGNGKMDWIMLRGNIRCASSSILKHHDGIVYPSDHYFIEAVLESPSKSK